MSDKRKTIPIHLCMIRNHRRKRKQIITTPEWLTAQQKCSLSLYNRGNNEIKSERMNIPDFCHQNSGQKKYMKGNVCKGYGWKCQITLTKICVFVHGERK